MKKLLGFTVFIAIAMLLLPLGVLKNKKTVISASTIVVDEPIKTERPEALKTQTFKVLINGEILELSSKDYIFGVVAAEMPALYHEEALKAQAVAAYTFACCRKAANCDKEYDITADHTVDQSFITEQKAREKWGGNADIYIEKIKKAVNDTDGLVITCNGELITAAYHAISSGKTEDCKNVWGGERPYLKSVSSEGDKLAANYISQAVFSQDELKEKLKNEIPLNGEPENYFGKATRTDSGTVTKITVCNKEITGYKLQKALELRSANFEVECKDNSFIFTVYGAGHGVGMSQNGANFMAKQGSSYQEILKHYYTGCEIN